MDMNLNSDQITGILRAIIPGVVGWFAAKGYIPNDVVTSFDSALVTVLSVIIVGVWSLHNNKTGKVIGQPTPPATPGS